MLLVLISPLIPALQWRFSLKADTCCSGEHCGEYLCSQHLYKGPIIPAKLVALYTDRNRTAASVYACHMTILQQWKNTKGYGEHTGSIDGKEL